MSGSSLAIDFGTSFTAAALTGAADDARPADVVVLPSVVALDWGGGLIVGEDAVALAAAHPDRAVSLVKPLVGQGGGVRLAGSAVDTVELVAALLAAAAERARAAVSPPGAPKPAAPNAERVVLTYPAWWPERAREEFGWAAAAAGFTAPEWMAEPLAVARHFLAEADRLMVADRPAYAAVPAPGRLAVVYDLGGGGAQWAVLRLPPAGAAAAPEWVAEPGHSAVEDAVALDGVMRELAARATSARPTAWPGGWTERNGPARLRAGWLHATTGAREALSRTDWVTVAQEGYGEAVIGREGFEYAAGPLLRAGVSGLFTGLRRAGLGPEDVDAVWLSGGAAPTPRLQALLTDAFGFAPATVADPKAAVVLGALADLSPPAKASAVAPGAAAVAATTPAAAAEAADLFDTVPQLPLSAAGGREQPPGGGPWDDADGDTGAPDGAVPHGARRGSRSVAVLGAALAAVVVLSAAAVLLPRLLHSASAAPAPTAGAPAAAAPPHTAAAAVPLTSAPSTPRAGPPVPPAGGGLSAALTGTWQGSERQTGLDHAVPVTLVLAAGGGSADYGQPPSCHDRLALLSTDGQATAAFTQTTTDAGCLPQAVVTLTAEGGGALGYVVTAPGGVSGRGTLTPAG